MTGPRERIVGSLLAGAVGDALGAPIEFASIDEIRRIYGPAGITGYDFVYGREGAVTDDTQMTLFTAEGLLRAKARQDDRGVCNVPWIVSRAYARWYMTQGGPDITDPELGSCNTGWLVTHMQLHSLRAPGSTCLSALGSGRWGTCAEPINDSKGCGGVMRVAPAGAAEAGPAAFTLGADCAAITHGHATGFLAAGVLAMVVGDLIRGTALPDAIDAARTELTRHPRHDETLRAIDAAVALAVRGTPTPEQLESLGGGWVAEEALAIGLCCALVHDGARAADASDALRAGLLLAVNHGGDSDSAGSIAGNLLGARYGMGAVPHDLRDRLEFRDLIEEIGHDLADAFVDGLPVPYDRYPPN